MEKKISYIYKEGDEKLVACHIKSCDAYGKVHYEYPYATSNHEVRGRLQKVHPALNAEILENNTTLNSTFEEFSALWLKNSSTAFKESTYIRYFNLVRHYLDPSFKQLKLTEITNTNIQNFCRMLEQQGKQDGTGLSPKTIADILSVLRRILRYAQSQQVPIDLTVFDIKVRQSPKSLKILSLSEQVTMQNYLMEHLDSMNLGILICLYTGIRVGELCALTWERISLSDKTLCICQTMQRIQKRTKEDERTHIIMDAPKSSSSNRTIPISTALYELLNLYPFEKKGYFLSGSSEIVEPRRIQYRFQKVLKDCHLNRCNFHILRHTFATRCVEANIDIKTLSEILGHSSVNITMNRYVHPSLNMKRDSMEKLADFITVK